jgi:hypothetical protein
LVSVFTLTVSPSLIKVGAWIIISFSRVTGRNELIIQAPTFIKEGDTVRVNTETNDYLERVKS